MLDGMPGIGVLAHAVAVAADVDDVAMVHEPIDERGSRAKSLIFAKPFCPEVGEATQIDVRVLDYWLVTGAAVVSLAEQGRL